MERVGEQSSEQMQGSYQPENFSYVSTKWSSQKNIDSKGLTSVLNTEDILDPP